MLKTFKGRIILAVSALFGALVTGVLITAYNVGVYTGYGVLIPSTEEKIYGWAAVLQTAFNFGIVLVVSLALTGAIVAIVKWVYRGV